MTQRITQWKNSLRKRVENAFAFLSYRFEGKATADAQTEIYLYRRKQWAHFGYAILFAAFVAWLLVVPEPGYRPFPLFQVGDVSGEELRSPITVDIEPKELPESTREDLAKKVPPVFDYDDTAIQSWFQNWEQAFRSIRKRFYTGKTKVDSTILDQVAEAIQKDTGQTLLARDLLFLHQQKFSEECEEAFKLIAKPLLGRLIALNDLFPSYYSTGIVVRQVNLALNEALVNDVSRIWSIDHARQLINHVLTTSPSGKKELTQRVASMVKYLLVPNLVFNSTITQKRILEALERKQSPVIGIKKGQVLVKKGERLSDEKIELLQAVGKMQSPLFTAARFALFFLILTVLNTILFRLELTRKGFWRLTLKNAVLFMAMSCLALMAIKFALPYLRQVFESFDVLYGVQYLLPLSAGGIIIHLMMGKELAYTYALTMAMICGLWLDRSFPFALWVFAVNACAIQKIGACKQRTDLYKAGLWSGFIGALLVLAYYVRDTMGYQSFDWLGISIAGGLAFFSGVLASILTNSFIPILETVFGYTTSLKLLELSNFNHPLLHNLMLKAPGTYHHSIIVGSLAEIAADRIKANPLLARVSAYYHDIGKMNKPLYFIENQNPNHNPHDSITPSMSAKILFSHVKLGVKMGREYNLGDEINAIIEQHHGTTLVSYFYNKAKKFLDEGRGDVNENDFRYPGPRPQTREAAIVMIADACEAATRSITEPTPAKIQAMVHNIINKRILDQQFHECELTFNDLQIIEECFTRTLTSLYHHRIEYPGQQQDMAMARAKNTSS